MNKIISGVDADHIHPVIGDRFDVAVEKLQDAEGRSKKQQPLKYFVNGNIEQAARPRPNGSHPFNCTPDEPDDPHGANEPVTQSHDCARDGVGLYCPALGQDTLRGAVYIR